MQLNRSRNTLGTFASIDDGKAEAEGLRRTSLCYSLPLKPLYSKDSTAAEPLCWADIVSESDEEDLSSCTPSVGPSSLSSFGALNSEVKVNDYKPAEKGAVLSQASGKARTPLSPLSSKASAFVPRSSQMMREFPQLPGGIAPQQVLTRPRAITTVMLCNLPSSYTRKDVVSTLNQKGFAGLYDFVYMPRHRRKGRKGYCFVNLVAGEEVQHFIEAFDGYWCDPSSEKACEVTLSHTQGLAALIERFRSISEVGDDVPERYRPAIFAGAREVFLEPAGRAAQPGLGGAGTVGDRAVGPAHVGL
jgi:hypothetical protein